MSPSNGIVDFLSRQVRKVPGAAAVEGEIKGAFALERDLPIKSYDKLTAAEINEKLSGLSQIDLATLDAYERKTQNRATVLRKLAALRTNEPWPGYDELTVAELEKLITKTDDPAKLKAVRGYELSHKGRSTVIGAADRGLAHAAA